MNRDKLRRALDCILFPPTSDDSDEPVLDLIPIPLQHRAMLYTKFDVFLVSKANREGAIMAHYDMMAWVIQTLPALHHKLFEINSDDILKPVAVVRSDNIVDPKATAFLECPRDKVRELLELADRAGSTQLCSERFAFFDFLEQTLPRLAEFHPDKFDRRLVIHPDACGMVITKELK